MRDMKICLMQIREENSRKAEERKQSWYTLGAVLSCLALCMMTAVAALGVI